MLRLDFLKDKSISNDKKSPYYWSPMVYYGSIENKRNSTYWLYILIGVSACIGLIIWFRNKKVLLSLNF
jgi:hypothetical protein